MIDREKIRKYLQAIAINESVIQTEIINTSNLIMLTIVCPQIEVVNMASTGLIFCFPIVFNVDNMGIQSSIHYVMFEYLFLVRSTKIDWF